MDMTNTSHTTWKVLILSFVYMLWADGVHHVVPIFRYVTLFNITFWSCCHDMGFLYEPHCLYVLGPIILRW